MAKQAGALKLTGPMGGISFYEVNGEYFAREKSGPKAETVLTSPRFARTRENAKEFRRAVRAGMLVRRCLKNLTKGLKLADSHISARLNALLTKVVKSDPVSDRGERMVSKGQIDMLEDFAFQKDKAFNDVFMAGPASTIDTDTGRMKIEVLPFDPQLRINGPKAATHFKIVTSAAAIDFEKEWDNWEHNETDYLSLGEYMEETICLEHAPAVKPGQTLLLAMGVVFYVQGEDGCFERVNGGVMKIIQMASPTPSGGGELMTPEVIGKQLEKAKTLEMPDVEFSITNCSAGKGNDEIAIALQAERAITEEIPTPEMELMNTG